MKKYSLSLRCLLCVVAFAATALEAGLSPKQYLKFRNQSNDVLSLSLEEACLPTYGAAKQRLIKPDTSILVEYDSSIANCVLIVPEKKELGVQTSLFVLEPTDTQYRSEATSGTCRIEISKIDSNHKTYGLESACVRVVATGH